MAKKEDNSLTTTPSPALFERVTAILEEARANVVRSVNHNMLIAYWLVGREIVDEIQQGEQRAKYGKQVLETLSAQLNKEYGKGFSAKTLWNLRQFYQVYPDKLEAILSPSGRESNIQGILSPAGRELKNVFNPNLSWSHYRALMRVKSPEARDFYEKEASECTWSKTQLERQIHSSYYERILSNNGKDGLLPASRERLSGTPTSPDTVLKSPVVLEFLGLPDSPILHEVKLESAIISQLQTFLLELGKGFAFVARQKRLHFDDKDLYVDLVFYNCILKFYLLIDLKIGELSHKDVGQMDGYVRMFEDLYTASDDNPSIGLILCTEKNEAVAKYSVLNDRQQIFASKYMLYLPTEEELAEELKKERLLIEDRLAEEESQSERLIGGDEDE